MVGFHPIDRGRQRADNGGLVARRQEVKLPLWRDNSGRRPGGGAQIRGDTGDAPEWCFLKTSIQALERKHPTVLGQVGTLTKIEHEYTRHGTRCLTAALEVATGQVFGLLTPNRPAEVFAEFVRQVCDRHAQAPRLHLVLDNLSTHYHRLICQLVAERCACDPGPLETGTQRKQFLTDPSKRVVFHFTPTHASWLNQIEIWFSTLTRKVLRRGNFPSLEDLEKKILAFINYHDAHLAKPYKWTYTGKPLATEAKTG
jgi:transposase